MQPLPPDHRQQLYLVADEMRGMASLERMFAHSIYTTERAERMMELAAKVAALAEQDHPDDAYESVRDVFTGDHWMRLSPAIGVDAAVFDAQDAILLIQRADNGRWAMPGGLAEVGRTLAESTLLELWEEAGLRGRVRQLLGIWDGRLWNSRSRVHLLNLIFWVECDDLSPRPGIEALDARFFARNDLPGALHPGHEYRVPLAFTLRDHARPGAFFDPADSTGAEIPMHQRPGAQPIPPTHLPTSRNGHVPDSAPIHRSIPASLLHLLTRT